MSLTQHNVQIRDRFCLIRVFGGVEALLLIRFPLCLTLGSRFCRQRLDTLWRVWTHVRAVHGIFWEAHPTKRLEPWRFIVF